MARAAGDVTFARCGPLASDPGPGGLQMPPLTSCSSRRSGWGPEHTSKFPGLGPWYRRPLSLQKESVRG